LEIKDASSRHNPKLKRGLRQIEAENVSGCDLTRTHSALNEKIKDLVKYFGTKNPQVILTKSYLSKCSLAFMSLKIRKFRFLESKSQYRFGNPPVSMNFEFKLPVKHDDEFLRILEKIIPLYLPSFYLEEITFLEQSSQKKFGEKSPKLLMTANSHFGDEEWKIIAARTKQNQGKIIVFQHGGNYGVGSFSLIQDYEFSICDYFLTWGWTLADDSRAIIAPATKLIRRIRRKKGKYLLFVTGENSLYSSWLTSMPIGPQIIPTLNASIKFLDYLNEKPKSEVRIRPYHLNYGLDQKRVFSEKFGENIISEPEITFLKDASKAKLVVCNHFSTTFIECISNDIPTIIYVNEKEWELSPQYQYIFDLLVNVGILHYSNVDCANFINQKYKHIEDWWASSRVQEVRKTTIEKIGFTGNKPIGELCRIISGF
jgi:putative transferase (TIGR04331 family)